MTEDSRYEITLNLRIRDRAAGGYLTIDRAVELPAADWSDIGDVLTKADELIKSLESR